MSSTKRTLLASLIWTALLPLLLFIPWVSFHVFLKGYKLRQTYLLWLDRNVTSDNGFLWLILMIWAVGLVVIALMNRASDDPPNAYRYSFDEYDRRNQSPPPAPTRHRFLGSSVVAITAVLALLASSFMFVKVIWDNDKDEANYYNAATVFHVPDLKSPAPSLEKVLDGATPGDGTRCELVGKHSTPSCIVTGTLDTKGFYPRVSSANAAQKIITRTVGDDSRVDALPETATYLYGETTADDRWSAILDGSGREKDLYGVGEWDGINPATRCVFPADQSVGRAFRGSRGNSLPNLLAEKFPRLIFNLGDAWGYCRDRSNESEGSPVIVIPVSEQAHVAHRTVQRPAGVLVYDGSSPFFTYQRTVKADQYPGPVYPMSMAQLQRERTQWAAGRKNMDRYGFGFEPTDLDSQIGNASEYLLRSQADNRLYWVTPLTPRESASEEIVAYSLIPADEVTGGSLNRLDVYSFKQGEPWSTNIMAMNTKALNYVGDKDPGFRQNGGVIREFTPITPDLWRAFGELNGGVKYLLEVSPTGRAEPRLVRLDEETGQPAGTVDVGGEPSSPDTGSTGTAQCGTDPASLTPAQLASCISTLANELADRQN